jgi:hypothetical protein
MNLMLSFIDQLRKSRKFLFKSNYFSYIFLKEKLTELSLTTLIEDSFN